MKIEFSSWETTDSTLHRRRKRPPNNEKKKNPPSEDHGEDVLVTHSFVKNMRARASKKSRTQGLDDVIPLLVLTSEKKVVVAGILKGEFVVSQNRQYPCPPGVSFFPKNDAPHVPAVLEKKSELMYAVQSQNTRIVCWSSMSDDPRDFVSKSLSKDRVLSLDVIPGKFSLVFGTVQGDKTRLAFFSLDEGAREINVRKFDLPGLPKGSESKLQHLATVGYEEVFDSLASKSQKTGKRKASFVQESKEHASEGMVVIQVLLSQSTLYVARHEIVAKHQSDVSSLERVVKVHQVPLSVHRQEKFTVRFVGHVGDLVVLSCHTASGNQLLLSISAKTGKLVSGPFDVGGKPQRFSLVNAQSVIAQVADGIVSIDLKSGAILQLISLPEELQSEKWILLGMDPRRGRVFVLVEHDNGYSVSSANVTVEDDGGSSKCLAGRLSQHVEARAVSDFQGVLLRRQSVPSRETGDGGYSTVSTTRKGVEMLNMACFMFESSRLNSNDGTLASMFAEAVETMARAEGTISQNEGRKVNPQQYDLNKKVSNKNGLVVSNGSSSKENTPVTNGGKSGKQTFKGHATATTPKALQISKNLQKIDPALISFVGVSVIRVLLVERDIGAARNVGRSILRKVLRSKKASARHLFGSPGGFSLPLVLKSLQKREGEEKVSYSPVELLFDILCHCKDTSERHMVFGAQYLLRHATAQDVAEYFERAQTFSENRSFIDLCSNYKIFSDASNPDPEALEKCSNMLLLRGSEAFVAGILAYSDCNETLLRRSVAEHLSRGEVGLLLKLVNKVISSAQKHNLKADDLQRGFLWTAALCERLNPLQSKEEKKLIKNLQASLGKEKDATSALLDRIMDLLETSIEDATASTNDEAGPGLTQMQLPSYQLERLVF